MPPKPNLLFVGAHPDDLELGAGGLISASLTAKYPVGLLILTDAEEQGEAEIRREEAIEGLCHLGASSSQIVFAGLTDGNIECNRLGVDTIRAAARSIMATPSIIVTHTGADAHLDHIRTSALVTASFRDVVVLGFAIPNSLITSRHRPSLFADIGKIENKKISSILKHKSQCNRGRIDVSNIARLHRHYEEWCGVEVSETFDETTLFAEGRSRHAVSSLIDDGILHRMPVLRGVGAANIDGPY